MIEITSHNVACAQSIPLHSRVKVRAHDYVLCSELSRLGYHTIDVDAQWWTMRRDLHGVRPVTAAAPPYPKGSELDEGKVDGCGHGVASCDPPTLLDLIVKSIDQFTRAR